MTRSVCVRSRPVKYFQNISIGHHILQADEPIEAGGKDAGPNPYELLMAALGACKSMTVRMYAERKHWPLQGVQVTLTHDKVHAADSVDCDDKAVLVDRIAVEISFAGSCPTNSATGYWKFPKSARCIERSRPRFESNRKWFVPTPLDDGLGNRKGPAGRNQQAFPVPDLAAY